LFELGSLVVVLLPLVVILLLLPLGLLLLDNTLILRPFVILISLLLELLFPLLSLLFFSVPPHLLLLFHPFDESPSLSFPFSDFSLLEALYSKCLVMGLLDTSTDNVLLRHLDSRSKDRGLKVVPRARVDAFVRIRLIHGIQPVVGVLIGLPCFLSNDAQGLFYVLHLQQILGDQRISDVVRILRDLADPHLVFVLRDDSSFLHKLKALLQLFLFGQHLVVEHLLSNL